MLNLNAFDDAVLATYLKLVLKAHACGHWGTVRAALDIRYVIRAAARHDPKTMEHVHEIVRELSREQRNSGSLH